MSSLRLRNTMSTVAQTIAVATIPLTPRIMMSFVAAAAASSCCSSVVSDDVKRLVLLR